MTAAVATAERGMAMLATAAGPVKLIKENTLLALMSKGHNITFWDMGDRNICVSCNHSWCSGS